jgi:hypothetical protein
VSFSFSVATIVEEILQDGRNPVPSVFQTVLLAMNGADRASDAGTLSGMCEPDTGYNNWSVPKE